MVEDHHRHDLLHIAMFPWFAMGHMKPYMHLSNKLADRGHRITFYLPPKAQPLISSANAHPDLITLVPVPLPRLPGLDPNVQTTADCDFHAHHLLATAYDRTAPFIESSLQALRPQAVFYDFAHWLPRVAKKLGIATVAFYTVTAAPVAHLSIPGRRYGPDIFDLPEDFPHPCVAPRKYEAVNSPNKPYGEGITILERLIAPLTNSDAIAVKACREMEGQYLDYIEKQSNKPVLTAGPALPSPQSTLLREDIAIWLNKQLHPKSVVYCAFGSEAVLPLSKFQELVLGIELTGLPFLIALRPPKEAGSIAAALPEGFEQRTGERGMVLGEWVQQQRILAHESLGCFVTHCGSGSLTEGLVSECQLVLLPHAADQSINARVMGRDLRAGVEVDLGEEDGGFDRYGVCEAVKVAMNVEDGVGKEVKMNHDKWRRALLTPGLESSCVDEMVRKLKELIFVAAAARSNISII